MPVLGLILAGGRGRRMRGADKALLRIGDRTMLEHVVARLRPQCPAGLVLSANGDPGRFGRGVCGPILPDSVAGLPGPLAGILAGLEFCAENRPDITRVLSVPTDVPLIPSDLVERLSAVSDRTPIVLAASGGREHFTVALWSITLRADLRRALVERQERRVGAFIARHGASAVEWPTGAIDPFLNVNTPTDLSLAEMASSSGG